MLSSCSRRFCYAGLNWDEAAIANRRHALIELSEAERAELCGLAARRMTAQRLALRARIVLAGAAGAKHRQVAAALSCDPWTVRKWRSLFLDQLVAGLRDEPRSGAPRSIDDQRIEQLIAHTLQSTRLMRRIGVPVAWRASGLPVSTL